MPRYPVSPTGVLQLVFFYLFKVIKIFIDLFKVSKMTIFNYDLFKVSDSIKKQGDPRDFLRAQFVKKGT